MTYKKFELQCICDSTGCPMPAVRRHQNTAYVNEESNYNTLCFQHQKETDEYWDERWSELYAGILG